MFGLKKSVNSSSDKSRSDFLDKDINNSHSVDDSKFIFYAKSEQFISKLEIYVQPNNYRNIKKLILIKNEADFKELSSLIVESFKSASEFKNISGLRVENLYKIQNEDRIFLPNKGYISDYLKSGDIIYCDITSEELWIKTYFKIIAYKFKKIIKLEYKIKKKMKFKQIKLILLKAGIELFWEELKQNNLNNTFNYYVQNIKFNNKKRQKSQTGFELLDFNKQLRYLDNNDEILVNIQFGIFEELIHKQLITMNINKKVENYLRLNEYCNLFFEELLSSKKFESELGTIQDICREFLTSQYNDLNTPFFFYNFKRKESVDEYIYNMINITNNNEPEIEENEDNEDDDDDEFNYEGDTSLGQFCSQDTSDNIGNINLIKFSRNNEVKKNKCDSNMIVIAPFLFKLIAINNKNGLTINNNINSKNGNVYRTFAHQNNNNNNIRERQDLNNFFIAPLSLDTKNNILKDDKNNVLYNDMDNTENDLTLDIGINKINNQNEKNNLNEFLYNDNQNNISKYYVKNDDIKSQKSKNSIFSLMRLSKQSNCCNELYNYFSQFEFIEKIKKKYRYYITKKVLEKIIVPECRDYESVDNNFVMFLQKKEKEEEHSITVKNKKLIIFLCLFFLYYILMIISVNML